MFVHICKQEKCPRCKRLSCSCDQPFIDTTVGWKLVCPYCSEIMMQCTVTTNSVNLTNGNISKTD